MFPIWLPGTISRGSKSLPAISLQPITSTLGSGVIITALLAHCRNVWAASSACSLEMTAHKERSRQGVMFTFLRILYTFRCFWRESKTAASHSNRRWGSSCGFSWSLDQKKGKEKKRGFNAILLTLISFPVSSHLYRSTNIFSSPPLHWPITQTTQIISHRTSKAKDSKLSFNKLVK